MAFQDVNETKMNFRRTVPLNHKYFDANADLFFAIAQELLHDQGDEDSDHKAVAQNGL